MTLTSARQPGLDLARALAIVAVLVCHMLVMAPSDGWAGVMLTYLGETGVNLFFALSGFLIGRIALRRIDTTQDVWHFWSRRWFRTLPAGVVMAVVVALLLHPGVRTFLATVTFTRGAARSSMQSPFLPHYWSLMVEEWFYLLLPLLLIAIGRTRRLAWLCGTWLGLAVLHVVAARALQMDYWQQATLTWMRLDAILAGVIAAEAEPLFRGRLASISCVVGWGSVAVLFAILALGPLPHVAERIVHMAQASLVPALLALTMPSMARWRPTRAVSGIEWRAVQWLATTTYALYLVHWDIYRTTAQWNIGPMLQIGTALVVSAGVAWLLHVVVERPGMRLRERLFADQPVLHAHVVGHIS